MYQRSQVEQKATGWSDNHLDDDAINRLSILRGKSQRPWSSKFSRGDGVWFMSFVASFLLIIQWFKGGVSDDHSLGTISIAKREDKCVSSSASASYDTMFHVGAIFIVWAVSTLACSFPILATRFPRLHISQRFFFSVRHFGTGILIATAFVHLLPTAFISLGDKCLSNFWVNDFPAAPGAIAMLAIFIVSVIEMVLHPASGGGGCMGGPHLDSHMQEARSPISSPQLPQHGHTNGMAVMSSDTLTNVSIGATLKEKGEDTQDLEISITRELTNSTQTSSHLTPDQKARKERLQCVLLELGILFHSIFIGMALSVAVGDDFMVLLVAICFHQTFEGLALGSRIAAISWTTQTKQPWFMAMAYGLTTPIGQAIGIATHTLYSPQSEVGLVMVGVMNAISAGLLTYASLVELLAVDFLSDESWVILTGKKRVIAGLLVFFGACCMSTVGAWA